MALSALSSRLSSFPSVETEELRRLQMLLPDDVRSVVELSASSRFQAEPIRGVCVSGEQIRLAIDLRQWEQLPRNGRDMLFWHQIARVRARSLPQSGGWEKTVFLFGVGSCLGEWWVRDWLLLGMALAGICVAGYRLSRRSHRARSIQSALAADLEAISLATQFGYPAIVARRSLIATLKWLHQHATDASTRDRYRVRWHALQALDFPSNSI